MGRGTRKQGDIRNRCALRVQVSPTRYRVPGVVVSDRTRPVEQTWATSPSLFSRC